MEIEDLRLAVYEQFLRGETPRVADLATKLSTTHEQARSGLATLACPACDQAHAWRVDDREPPVGDQVAHFLVPAARMWDDVVYTCGNQRIFCSEDCVTTWLDRSGHQRGYVMDLPTLWRLASGWYTGRLERGYTRREPSAAADYLRSVGLAGTFWGLS